MAVLDPLRVTITNWPGDHPGQVSIPDFPADPSRGSHLVPFERTLYIERDDFRQVEGTSSVCSVLTRDVWGIEHVFYLYTDKYVANGAANCANLVVLLKRWWSTHRQTIGEVKINAVMDWCLFIVASPT